MKADGMDLGPPDQRSFDLIARAGKPAVVLDRTSADPRFDYATINDRDAILDAAGQLIALGHWRIFYIVSYPVLVTTQRRIRALQEAIASAARPAEATVMERGDDEAAFRLRLAATFCGAHPPTAMIASNTIAVLWITRALSDVRLSVLRDVSLLACKRPVLADIV